MLPFLYLQSFIYTLLVASGLGYLFENFFDSELLTAHSIIDIHKVIEHEKYSFPEISLPHVICGPLSKSNIISRRLTSIYNENIVNVAGVRHIDNEICYLLHSEPSKASQIQDEEWVIHPLPSVTKIHQSVLEYFQHEDILQDTTTDLNIKSTIKRRLHAGKVYADPKLSNDLLIGIQFVPGLLKPDEFPFKPDQILAAQSALEPILNRWSTAPDKDSAGDNDCVELMSLERSGGGTWHTVRETAVQRSGGKDACACALPSSTEIEYEGDFVRIVNLQDFAGTGAGCLARLVDIAAMDSTVLSVTLEDRPRLLNYAARGVLQSGTAGNEVFADAGITGEGSVVGIADSGLNDMSCFFYDNTKHYATDYTTRCTIYDMTQELRRRKVVQYISYGDGQDSVGGHGTHVSASIAGESLVGSFSFSNGVAPKAKLAFLDMQVADQDYITVPNLYYYVFKSSYEAGARVHSDSWGSLSSGMYTSRTLSSDSFVYSYPQMLVVFAAGNSGADYGKKSVYNPCLSKNVLCVGSTNLRDDVNDEVVNNLEVSYFSSLGPTFDGRIKPDVMGPGFKIISALSGESTHSKSCGVTEMQGTSMAAPLVAGLSVLARDYFMKVWPNVCTSGYMYCRGFYPSGFLLKAVIIHSGRPVQQYSDSVFDGKTYIASHSLGQPPDNFQGYGQITLNSVLPLKKKSNYNLYVYDNLNIASKAIYLLTLEITTLGPLKVTLVWYDPPSSVGNTNSLLIHNLDLTVIDPNGDSWLGNDAYMSGVTDYYNPQEQVYIEYASEGKYSVYIEAGYFSYSGSQNCGIVITCPGVITAEPVSYNGYVPLNSLGAGNSGQSVTIEDPIIQNASYSKGFYVSQYLSYADKQCIGTFSMHENSILSSVQIDLESSETGGSAAFLFTVLLQSPDHMLVQIGGYQTWYQSYNIFTRTWPVQWAGKSAGSQSAWRARRNLEPLYLNAQGRWAVCVSVIYPNWPTTKYTGKIILNFKYVEPKDKASRTQILMSRMADWIEDNVAVFTLILMICGSLLLYSIMVLVNRVRKADDYGPYPGGPMATIPPRRPYSLPWPLGSPRKMPVDNGPLNESEVSNYYVGQNKTLLEPLEEGITRVSAGSGAGSGSRSALLKDERKRSPPAKSSGKTSSKTRSSRASSPHVSTAESMISVCPVQEDSRDITPTTQREETVNPMSESLSETDTIVKSGHDKQKMEMTVGSVTVVTKGKTVITSVPLAFAETKRIISGQSAHRGHSSEHGQMTSKGYTVGRRKHSDTMSLTSAASEDEAVQEVNKKAALIQNMTVQETSTTSSPDNNKKDSKK